MPLLIWMNYIWNQDLGNRFCCEVQCEKIQYQNLSQKFDIGGHDHCACSDFLLLFLQLAPHFICCSARRCCSASFYPSVSLVVCVGLTRTEFILEFGLSLGLRLFCP
ncbi:hypothetical protein Nepgr_005858 [Nepenthes gracilis]|uniref:Uncharacterized protein n=1 Tax=Nepenthes gracilis TaxID=150966 RepID=A0AAD3XGS6_NEPGR|nr:hypothetical protein Nepgr_005858 [Nepenthes gracilis]